MSENNEIIKQNILSRDLLLEIILTAIFISFGLNLIVTSFSNLNSFFNVIMLIMGIITVISSAIVLIYNNFRKFNRTIVLKGFIVYDAKENRLIDVDNYGLSNELVCNLNSAFEEDESLKTIWENTPLRYVFGPFELEGYTTSAKEIIEESFEYFIFHRLSSTLHHFFNSKEFDEKDLKIYEREDIPDALLNNRFLNLFSKPIDQREAFVDKDKEDGVFFESEGGETLYMSYGKGGVLYHKLHLVLPAGTNVKRHDPNGIVLESNQIVLNFDIHFEGFNTILPKYFQKYYLDLDLEWVSEDEQTDVLRFQVFDIGLKIDVKFKIRSLFSNTVWKQNEWLDSYLNSLNKEISMDYFFESINWEQISTLLYIVEKKGN